jgi:hypothetical protein
VKEPAGALADLGPVRPYRQWRGAGRL